MMGYTGFAQNSRNIWTEIKLRFYKIMKGSIPEVNPK